MFKWLIVFFKKVFTTPYRNCVKWARDEQTYNERILVGEPRFKPDGDLHAVLDNLIKEEGSHGKYRDRYGHYAYCPLLNNRHRMTFKLSRYEMDEAKKKK